MTIFALVILIGLVALLSVLLVLSPGRLTPLTDRYGNPIVGSLSERVFVKINGIRQGMFIQSVDTNNPVLLLLHGGPGLPTFFLNTTHPTGLEKHFTLVWWEQRGAGISFSTKIPKETMTIDQMIGDTICVSNYLRARFNKEKIYLLGHSWGSFLGIQVAAKAPDLFHAYVGMAQITYQLQSEVLAHAFILDVYTSRKNEKMVRELQGAPVTLAKGISKAWMRIRDPEMHKLGIGTTHDMRSIITGIFLPIWREPAYKLTEKVAIWRGKDWSRRCLWEQLLNTDLSETVLQLKIPVYFFIGHHDYTSNQNLAAAYFRKLDAPLKGYYTFYHAAHSPIFEEPDLALKILREDVLHQRNSLANPEFND